MFKCLRIQILKPCQGRCKWCATYKKNPLFKKLAGDGRAGEVHDFYARAVARFKPEELYVSGGEPLLMEGIGRLMRRMADHVGRIHLFTSYQFTEKKAERLDLDGMPWDKVVLTHTILYFRNKPWERLTDGFPFGLYVDNVRRLGEMPWRKCYKFIVNHPDSDQEIGSFLDRVPVDERTTIRWKLMNQQARNKFNLNEISRTRDETLERLARFHQRVKPIREAVISTGANMDQSITGMEVLEGLKQSRSVKRCPYRQKPEELRFAFYKARGKKLLLKYRFCPHFPPSFGYLHQVGSDRLEDIQKAFEQKVYTQHCEKCRLQHYVPDGTAGLPRERKRVLKP